VGTAQPLLGLHVGGAVAGQGSVHEQGHGEYQVLGGHHHGHYSHLGHQPQETLHHGLGHQPQGHHGKRAAETEKGATSGIEQDGHGRPTIGGFYGPYGGLHGYYGPHPAHIYGRPYGIWKREVKTASRSKRSPSPFYGYGYGLGLGYGGLGYGGLYGLYGHGLYGGHFWKRSIKDVEDQIEARSEAEAEERSSSSHAWKRSTEETSEPTERVKRSPSPYYGYGGYGLGGFGYGLYGPGLYGHGLYGLGHFWKRSAEEDDQKPTGMRRKRSALPYHGLYGYGYGHHHHHYPHYGYGHGW